MEPETPLTEALLSLFHATLCDANRVGRLLQDQYPVNSPSWKAIHELCGNTSATVQALYERILTVHASR